MNTLRNPASPLPEHRRQLLTLALLAAGFAATACAAPPLLAGGAVWPPVPMPPQAPANTGLASLPGTRLAYWDTGGTGPVVVLMHAASQSATGWSYQQPAFAAAGFRTIGYSRRGYTGSDADDPNSPGVASEDLKNC